jgi:hypothetical protein
MNITSFARRAAAILIPAAFATFTSIFFKLTAQCNWKLNCYARLSMTWSVILPRARLSERWVRERQGPPKEPPLGACGWKGGQGSMKEVQRLSISDKNDLVFCCVGVEKTQIPTGSHIEKHALDPADFKAIMPVADNGDRRVRLPVVFTLISNETLMAPCRVAKYCRHNANIAGKSANERLKDRWLR